MRMAWNGMALCVSLYCFLCLSVTLSAKPIDHAQHLALVGRHVADLMTPIGELDTDILKSASLEQRDTTTLFKRDGTWTVEAGDTGNSVAARLGISFAQLASSNPTVEWRNLQIGQVLNIPCADGTTWSQSYSVVAGDTGNAIAARNGITFEMLSAYNPGVVWNNLQIGQVLVVPNPTAVEVRLSSTAASEPKHIATTSSTELGSEDVESVVEPVPVTTEVRGKSPSLTPAPPKRSLTYEAGATPEVVKVHLVRNENVLSTAPLPSIFPALTYTIKAGDTGYAIASAYGISFEQLSRANPGVIWTNLQVGQKVVLPKAVNSCIAPTSPTISLVPTRKAGEDIYTLYAGPANTPAYPLISAWLTFDALWTLNLHNIGMNCDFNSEWIPSNTQHETLALRSSIIVAANETGVNPAFILAMVMQESQGCVRVPTTTSWEGIRNPGLLQSFNGIATCNNGTRSMQPCPDTMIQNMVNEGVKGIGGVGIAPALRQAALLNGITWPLITTNRTRMMKIQEKRGDKASPDPMFRPTISSKLDEAVLYYQAARIYNSGSIPASGDLSGATGSTRCYVSDIVNRLMGWVAAPRRCWL